MGLFDSLAKHAMGSLLGGSNTGGGVDLSTLMSVFSNQGQTSEAVSGLLGQVGGMSGLMERFNQAGLGDIAQSWVGTGENLPVAPAQIEAAIGPEMLMGFASRLGLNTTQIMPLLAQFLPVIIDKLTPGGQIDSNHPTTDSLQGIFTSVIKSTLSGKPA
jgi:uncharacterized protein YidB (DUF937 family)